MNLTAYFLLIKKPINIIKNDAQSISVMLSVIEINAKKEVAPI